MDETADRFSLLSQRRRLLALSVLKDHGGPMSLEALTTAVGVRELGAAPDELAEDQRERIRLSFHHSHLPKLTEAGLVDYDAEDDRVRLADGADDLRRILDVVFDD